MAVSGTLYDVAQAGQDRIMKGRPSSSDIVPLVQVWDARGKRA
jgi:hypothetical protein